MDMELTNFSPLDFSGHDIYETCRFETDDAVRYVNVRYDSRRGVRADVCEGDSPRTPLAYQVQFEVDPEEDEVPCVTFISCPLSVLETYVREVTTLLELLRARVEEHRNNPATGELCALALIRVEEGRLATARSTVAALKSQLLAAQVALNLLEANPTP